MSNRIDRNLVPFTPLSADSNQAQARVRAQQARAEQPTAAQIERWRATSNDEAATPMGRVPERMMRQQLRDLRPGDKLAFEVGAEVKIGQTPASATGAAELSLSRLEDGRYQVSAGGKLGAKLGARLMDFAGVEAGVTGGVKADYVFETPEGAADLAAALAQVGPGLLIDVDPDVMERIEGAAPRLARLGFSVDGAAGGKVAPPAGFAAGLQLTGATRCVLDLEARTLSQEQELGGRASLMAGASVEAGVARASLMAEVAGASSSTVLRHTWSFERDALADLQQTRDLGRFLAHVAGGTSESQVVQKHSMSVAGNAISSERAVSSAELRSPADVARLLSPSNVARTWSVGQPKVESRAKLDLGIVEAEVKLTLQRAPERTGRLTLDEVVAAFSGKASLDTEARARAAQANLGR